MSNAYQVSRDQVVKALEEAVDPSRLSREDYKALLADLIEDFSMRLHAANYDEDSSEEST